MPDAAESVPFWSSVAATFKGNDAVIFDLFNEPYPEAANNSNETKGWQCWLNGGSSCIGISYPVAGMQTLVNTVRATGANNVIMLGGLDLSTDLTQWLAYEPEGSGPQSCRLVALLRLHPPAIPSHAGSARSPL